MKTKLTLKQLAARIEQHRKRIAKERDSLRDLISEANELQENADDATHALRDAVRGIEEAADSLSKNA